MAQKCLTCSKADRAQSRARNHKRQEFKRTNEQTTMNLRSDRNAVWIWMALVL